MKRIITLMLLVCVGSVCAGKFAIAWFRRTDIAKMQKEWYLIKPMVSSVIFFLLTLSGILMAEILPEPIYIDDGEIHTVSNNIFQNSLVYLDSIVANSPGTHFELANDGEVMALYTSNNSSVTVSGGLVAQAFEAYDSSTIFVNGGLINWSLSAYHDSIITVSNGSINNALDVFDSTTVSVNGGSIGSSLNIWNNSSVTVSGGSIGSFINARDESLVSVSGGSITRSIVAYNNSLIDISGGTIGGYLYAYQEGTINLYGDDFGVGGQSLSYGDSLRDYGVINGDFLTGTITGMLQDGSILNNQFNIRLDDLNADIIVIPEPASLLLLGAGGLLLRKRRS